MACLIASEGRRISRCSHLASCHQTEGARLIEPETCAKLQSRTESFWQGQVSTPEFTALAKGKEIGHRIADYVDEQTTAMLQDNFNVVRELDSAGQPRSRSMGDVWIVSNGMANPLNVKSGEVGKGGQPNLVSLTKLIKGLLLKRLDSYYLLIVKMQIPELQAGATVIDIVPNVYLVDMLDVLPFVTFDAGPGQAMLREKQFYEAMDQGWAAEHRPLTAKVEDLFELMEDGHRRLLENRKNTMLSIREDYEAYVASRDHTINQVELNLG